jgi:hypothetical protein
MFITLISSSFLYEINDYAYLRTAFLSAKDVRAIMNGKFHTAKVSQQKEKRLLILDNERLLKRRRKPFNVKH